MTMKYANVQNGNAIEVVRVNPFNIFHQHYAEQFVECPEEVEVGWTYSGSVWAAPPPDPSLALAKARAIASGNGKSMIRRRAKSLFDAGKEVQALLLLKTIGE